MRCAARYSLRGFRIGEAAHPGPPRLRILLDSASQWSQLPIVPAEGTSTVAASQGAIPRNLVEFRGHEQATRVDSETGSIRSDPQGGSDTESIAGISEQGDVAEVVDATPAEAPVNFAPRASQYSESLVCLDGVRLRDVFDTRAVVMHSVPFFLRGVFRGALKVSLQAIMRGYEQHSDLRITRGWKLFMLLPRMLLFRPRRGGKVPKKRLEERFHMFQEGRWLELLASSRGIEASVHQSSVRRRRRQRQDDGVQRRVDRAHSLVRLGELSAARQALEGANVAPGTLTTLRDLTSPVRRPPVPRHELSQEILRSEPVEVFELDGDALLTCLRTARRGAAPGPSGMTADHLFPILESETDSELLVQVASKLAIADVPEEVIDGIRLGRLTALAKPDGGVKEIVVGDIVRRLVARTIAKQFAKRAEVATAPFQYRLSTKAGCECVAHIVQALTDQDANATVVTVDGLGAFDLISKSSLLEGLLRMEDGDQILPFARCLYGSPSTYLWEDELGNTQEIPKVREGNRATPSMPMLFSLGEHPALEAIQRRLADGEKLLAYLDDVTVICRPERVRTVITIIDEELARHAHVNIHYGKTQVWNRGGVAPEGIDELTRLARLVKPEAVV